MASSCSLARSLVSPDAALARDWYLLRHQSPWGASDGGRAYRLVRPAEDSHLRYETFQAPPPATVYAEPFPGPAVPLSFARCTARRPRYCPPSTRAPAVTSARPS